MVAKMASIVIGSSQKHTNRLTRTIKKMFNLVLYYYDHNVVVSYGCGQQQNQQWQKMQAHFWHFQLPWRWGSTTQGASPDGAHPGLYFKPLDATNGRVPAPYCPSRCQGHQFWMKPKTTNKTQLLASYLRVDWHKKAKQFRDPKQIPYLAHWCNKLP